MNQKISKARKVMCILGGASYLILNILAVIVMMHEINTEEILDQKLADIGIFLVSLVIAVILVLDIISVFSESFRIKLETTERTYKFIPVLEVVLLIMSASNLLLLILGISLFLIFIGLFGADVIAALLAIIIFSAVVSANLIMILISKTALIKNNKNLNNPQMYYPMPNSNGLGYPPMYNNNNQAGNFPIMGGGTFAQGSNFPQSGNANFVQGNIFPQSGNSNFVQGSNFPQNGNQ